MVICKALWELSYTGNCFDPYEISSLFFSFQKALILISVLFGTIYCAELESRAKLLASKNVLNQFIVENRDLSVVYKIYNVGSR